MKKIDLQTQNPQSPHVTPTKAVGWCAINVDGIKITIDAYDGIGVTAVPRHDSLIEVVDEKEVFEITPELLLDILRFYCDYAQGNSKVVRYHNRNHCLVPDRFRDGKER